jgi:hypothetical protein
MKGKDLEGGGLCVFNDPIPALSWIQCGESREISLITAGSQDDIRSGYPWNTSLKGHRYSTLLCACMYQLYPPPTAIQERFLTNHLNLPQRLDWYFKYRTQTQQNWLTSPLCITLYIHIYCLFRKNSVACKITCHFLKR